ncbi:MAG: DUF1361 domain-containing protein [Cyanobacteria bacterium P01_C01_bin.72]
MIGQLLNWLTISSNLFNQSTARIIWNLFLAFIPLGISFYLFRPQAIRNIWWWTFLLIFIAFLPNAPYVLTDSIHIIELSQQNYPRWAIMIILIPQYLVFITLGFEAYVIALSKLQQYLQDLLSPRYITLIKAIAHSLCVVGVYIGRFERFNSWDFITRPAVVLLRTAQDLLDGAKLLSMAIALVVIWLLSELLESVNQRIVRLKNSGDTYS